MCGSRILVIDDDDLLRFSLRAMLERWGYEVVEATDGAVGLRVIGECQPDLVLLDVLMPHCDGIEVLLEIRKLPVDTRIVAMSGGGMVGKLDYLRVAEHLGADASLSKPIKWTTLLATIEELVGGGANLATLDQGS